MFILDITVSGPGGKQPAQGAAQLSLPSLTQALGTLTALYGKLLEAGNKKDADKVKVAIGVVKEQVKDFRSIQQGFIDLAKPQ